MENKITGMVFKGANDPHFATKAIHIGQDPEQWGPIMPVVPPISMSSTFKQKIPGGICEYEYARSGNPTRNCLEKCIASLECGKYGFCFASGLAATDTITHMLHSGDHVVCSDDVYGGTSRYFRRIIGQHGVEISFVDSTDLDRVRKSIKNNTKMFWLETPTNPTMKLSDIEAIGHILRMHEGILFIVDNTFMTPYFQKPLLLGADISMHSLTKYMNGHSDVVMGAIVTSREDIAEKIKFYQNSIGAVPSPMDCYLVNRGLKTLHLRMREHMRNGLAMAKFLETHTCVEKVIHPGLPSHPQYKLSLKQTSGTSGMVAFYLKGGLKEAQAFFDNLKVFTLAESLGGYESLAELPALMTHASILPEDRQRLGITDSLIRLSVGLESTEDLINDVDQALKASIQIIKPISLAGNSNEATN